MEKTIEQIFTDMEKRLQALEKGLDIQKSIIDDVQKWINFQQHFNKTFSNFK